MSKDIIINCGPRDTRVAVLENGELVELYLENQSEQRLVGNIYKGKVSNILPGMQAAFIDVGLPKNAFLYVDDALENVVGVDELPEKINNKTTIKDVLKPGQSIIVQVAKEPFGTKGARVTRHITIPGRFLVFMPTVDYVGISRRIAEGDERDRLRKLAHEHKPAGTGLIVRTMAEGVEGEELKKDIDALARLWKRIRTRGKTAKAPSLLHKDFDLLYRIVRDSFDHDVARVVVDNAQAYEVVLGLLEDTLPQLKDRVFLFQQNRPVFEVFGIEPQIDKIVEKKVWLKCGGYIVIDQTEALTSVDVNTGKFVGSTNLADTVLKTNLEAAREIARQLRLRNIGGIIIIDFIDMESAEHQKKVLAALGEAAAGDKVKSSILGLTQLGLVEMTRQKARLGLADSLLRPCPCCDGSGRVLAEDVAGSRIEGELKRFLETSEEPAVLVQVHPMTAGNLIGVNAANLERLEKESGKRIFIRGSIQMKPDEYKITLSGSVLEVERAAIPVSVGEIHTLLIDSAHNTRPQDGVARVEGYVIQVEQAGTLVGQKATFEVTKVHRTFAKAKLYFQST
ncbi:MAG: Rne/Rng family ribonuclease [Selenomonadales bacterium]|jgi:ribonuclease G|nr:Rne/Rng family ribonuclease [Selenomonadales bacterium]